MGFIYVISEEDVICEPSPSANIAVLRDLCEAIKTKTPDLFIYIEHSRHQMVLFTIN